MAEQLDPVAALASTSRSKPIGITNKVASTSAATPTTTMVRKRPAWTVGPPPKSLPPGWKNLRQSPSGESPPARWHASSDNRAARRHQKRNRLVGGPSD